MIAGTQDPERKDAFREPEFSEHSIADAGSRAPYQSREL
jgi:hypothetical protein